MMKKLFLLLSLAFIVSVQAQRLCGTAEPTQAEYDHIKNVVSNYQIHKNAGTTCIPIKPVIVRETNGSGGLSLADLNDGISYLNEYFYPAGIEFFICGSGPVYVDNSNYYDFQSTTDEAALAAAAGEDGTAINMYFVEWINYTGGSSYTAGYAYSPSPSIQSTRIVLKFDDVAGGETIIHEMGHHFGLLHTFSEVNGNPTQELVDGSNCTSSGDLICDTPADPGFTGANFNYTTCSYTPSASEVDANNQQYNPMTENIMSYYPTYAGCPKPVLTTEQITRIQQGLIDRQNNYSNFSWGYNYNCSATNVVNPSNLVATLNGTDVDLTWTDNANNETGYFIEVSTTSATTGFNAYGGLSTGPNTTSLTHNAGATTGTFYYRVKASNDGCNDYSNVDSVVLNANCDAGNLASTLINTTVDYCPNTSITLQTDGSHYIPTGEIYLFAFATATDTLYYNVNGTNYSGDLNATLTTPIPAGSYTIYGVVTENSGTDLCDFTTGSFTINVLDQSDPACSATACEAGLVNASLAGTTVDYCPGGSITLDTDSNFQIPTGGGYNWVFLNPGVDTFFIAAGSYYSGDINAALTTPMPAGTYTVLGVVDNGTNYCSQTANSFTINILDGTSPSCACLVGDVNASLDGNTYDYCPGGTVDLLTDGNQAVPTGEDYIWVFINLTDTVFIPVTGANYSGDINADLVAGGSTPIPNGTYSVFAALTENGGTAFCGATPGDFTVNILAANDPACTNPCSITDINAVSQSACFPSSNTYTQSVTITYTNAPTGTINVNGQTFAVTSSPQTVTLTALNANGNSVDVTAFFTNTPACTYTETAVFTAPPACAPVCDITTITSGTQTACNVSTNTYSQDVILTYDNPAAGAINVNGQVFVVGPSPQTVTLTNLPADGNPVDVTAFFTANTNCSATETAVFTAPSNCTPVCDITAIATGTQTACDPGTNTYSQTVTITYANAPSGTINVNGQTFTVTSSPQSVILGGLTANGNSVDVTAFFTSNNTCTFTQNSAFTAATSCAVIPCNITALTTGTQSACDPATDTYTQEVTITYNNAPPGTINVNGQTFTQTNSPQTVTLTNLPSNGNSVDLTAFFTNDNNCTLTETGAFTAPISCATPNCSAGDVSATLDGTTIDYCPGTTIDLISDGNENILTGEAYIWVFINNTDTVFINAGANYTGDVNADLVAGGATPIPAGTYTVFAFTTDGGGANICDVTPGDFTINVLAANDPACAAAACSAGDVSATIDGTTIDYCPGSTIDLISDGNENILTGEAYIWVFINNTDTVFINAGANYTGDVNADLVAGGATPIPAGTYTVFAFTTDGGGANICDVTPGDFTINVLAANDPACTNPCSISAITSGVTSACNPSTNTYSQDVTITYANAPTGTINVNGQTFNVTTSPQTVTLTNLPANGNSVNVVAFFTNSASCTFTQNNLFNAPASCAVTPCNISNIAAGTSTACNPTTNTYAQDVIITYTNAPTGTINVNGQTFNVTTSPQTVTLTNLPANGNSVNVTASFTNASTCSLTTNGLFNAPVSCAPVGPTDTLIVIMYPDGAGTLYVGNDVISTTPFVGIYPSNSVLNIAASVTGTNTFDFWRLNNLSLLDYSPSTSFAFINQDTLFAYFNGAVSIGDVSESFSTFNLYPTVFDNQINVEFEAKENANVSVDLYSIDGKLVNNLFQQQINSNVFYKETFNINVSSGMYFIKVSSENSSFSQKIIKY